MNIWLLNDLLTVLNSADKHNKELCDLMPPYEGILVREVSKRVLQEVADNLGICWQVYTEPKIIDLTQDINDFLAVG